MLLHLKCSMAREDCGMWMHWFCVRAQQKPEDLQIKPHGWSPDAITQGDIGGLGSLAYQNRPWFWQIHYHYYNMFQNWNLQTKCLSSKAVIAKFILIKLLKIQQLVRCLLLLCDHWHKPNGLVSGLTERLTLLSTVSIGTPACNKMSTTAMWPLTQAQWIGLGPNSFLLWLSAMVI